MSNDVLADWKSNKFIIADPNLTDTNNHTIILTDIEYWANNVNEFTEWCENTEGVKQQGMILEIQDDKILSHFVLRWS